MIAEKAGMSSAATIKVVWCHLAFALLRSSITALCGSRCRLPHAGLQPLWKQESIIKNSITHLSLSVFAFLMMLFFFLISPISSITYFFLLLAFFFLLYTCWSQPRTAKNRQKNINVKWTYLGNPSAVLHCVGNQRKMSFNAKLRLIAIRSHTETFWVGLHLHRTRKRVNQFPETAYRILINCACSRYFYKAWVCCACPVDK